jgi:Domain of unknown function (DUF2804), C-terminal/Domain of unknown function (DUF2804), N-terminal
MYRSAKGRPPFGILTEPVGPLERDLFEPRNPMGGKAGWLARKFGFKHFQYMGAVSDDLYIGCAIADTGLVTNVFAYIFDPRTGRMQKRGWQTLRGKGFTYNPDPDSGESRFESKQGSVLMKASRDAASGKQVKVLQVEFGGDLEIDMSFEDGALYEPMRICTQTGAAGWTYAQKVAGVPARGGVKGELGTFDLEAANAFAHHDFTVGHLRRETYWHWACFSGIASGGEALGLNLSCGVNETSFTENCIWSDGRLIKVDTVLFEFNPDDLDQPWRVSSYDKKIDLTFTPSGAYRAHQNALIAATDFHQMFGTFDGVIRTPDKDIEISGMHGFAERQYAKW